MKKLIAIFLLTLQSLQPVAYATDNLLEFPLTPDCSYLNPTECQETLLITNEKIQELESEIELQMNINGWGTTITIFGSLIGLFPFAATAKLQGVPVSAKDALELRLLKRLGIGAIATSLTVGQIMANWGPEGLALYAQHLKEAKAINSKNLESIEAALLPSGD